MDRCPKVGVFDSGIGGLSVLGACLGEVPGAEYAYLGDNARAPYGSRTEGEILAFTDEALGCFLRLGTDAVILACNTATAVAAEAMRKKYPFPVIGVEPALKQAARSCGNVLLLATPVTAASPRVRALADRLPGTRFDFLPLPRLAAAIEDHVLRGAPLNLSEHIPKGLAHARAYDGAVLGCTHYALVAGQIGAYLGLKLFDGARGTARRLKTVLISLGFPLDRSETERRDHLFALPASGTADHPLTPHDPHKWGKGRVIFLGNSKKLNEYAYNTNICFQYFRKKFPDL